MTTSSDPAKILPRRCPVCGSREIRLHRIERPQDDPEPEPDSKRFMCAAGHVFRFAPQNDPRFQSTSELIARAKAMVAESRRLAANLRKLVEASRNNTWHRR